jgi:hypothetical protein
MPCLINTSPTLRRAWLEAVDRYAGSMARVLVEDSGGALSLSAAKILGFSIVAIFSVVIDEIGRGTKEGADIRALTKRLGLQVDDAIDRMAEGLNSAGPA